MGTPDPTFDYYRRKAMTTASLLSLLTGSLGGGGGGGLASTPQGVSLGLAYEVQGLTAAEVQSTAAVNLLQRSGQGAEGPSSDKPATVALGRADPTGAKQLEEFAEDKGALTFKGWQDAGLTNKLPPKAVDLATDADARRYFGEYFMDAIVRNAGKVKIHFQLDTIIASTKDIGRWLAQTTRLAAQNPWGSELVTKTELFEVLKNPQLLKDTTFWLKGQKVTLTEAQLNQLQQTLDLVIKEASAKK